MMIKVVDVNRYHVGSRPLGVLLEELHLIVYEAGDGTVSDYDLYHGELLGRITLPGKAVIEMSSSSQGGLLLGGQNGQLFAWAYIGEGGIVYRVNPDKVIDKISLGPYHIQSWVYSEAAQKLLITHDEDPRLVLVRADLSLHTIHSFESKSGAIVLAGDGKTAYVGDNYGESVSVVDLATEKILDTIPVGSKLTNEFPHGVMPPDSFYLSILELDDEYGSRSAPLALSPDQRFLYVCPTRSDEPELRTPLAVVRLADRGLRRISGEGIRFPYSVRPNPVSSEIYVSGIDKTVIVDLTTDTVTGNLGPGRFTGFTVAPNGKWAVGVDVLNVEIFVIDLETNETQSVPFAGQMEEGEEYDHVPVRIDVDSQVAVVADIPANQVVVLKVGTV